MREMTKVWLHRGKVYCKVNFNRRIYRVHVDSIKQVRR